MGAVEYLKLSLIAILPALLQAHTMLLLLTNFLERSITKGVIKQRCTKTIQGNINDGSEEKKMALIKGRLWETAKSKKYQLKLNFTAAFSSPFGTHLIGPSITNANP